MDHHHQQQLNNHSTHSRPPSVDSVHLGSTYSGYFQSPPQQQQPPHPSQQLLQQNIPLVSQHQPQQQQYLPYQVSYNQGSYSAAPQQQQPVQNFYPNSGGYAPGAIVPASNNGHQQQPLPYQYNLSASAAAAAAAAAASASFQHQQQQQQNILSPLAQRHHFAGDGMLPQHQQSPGNYHLQQQQWPGTTPVVQSAQQLQYLLQHPQAAAGLPQLAQQLQQPGSRTVPNDAYSLYVSQYYREYYRNYLQMYRHQQAAAAVRTKTPLKYGSRLVHARAAFSAHDNRLLVLDSPNSRVLVYGLADIFTEQIYPHLFLQSLLLPGDLSGGLESKTLLPFSSKDVALEWIRAKMLDFGMNYELKLILQVITMLYRQNGAVSGLDLSELLYKIVIGENNGGGNSFVSGGAVGLQNANGLLGNNESSDSVLGGADRLSQTGSEAPMSLSMGGSGREVLLGQLRQLLTRGQRRVAITFAQNNSLFDHALALTYLLSFQSSGSDKPSVIGGDCALMIATIRKFITSSLESNDPLYVFYSHLLQIATNATNNASANNSSFTTSTPQQQPSQSLTGCAKIESLESFIILLANDIKFEKVEIANNSLKNLIDLMVALLKEEREYVLPDELFTDRFDCLLVNECLEFARFGGERLNPRLLLRKLEFAIELFDYGFVRPAISYCDAIRTALVSGYFELKSLAENTAQMKASRLTQFLLPPSSWLEASKSTTNDWEDGGEQEEERRTFVLNLWQYQMAKMLTRVDPSCTLEAFDSPLIEPPKEREVEEEEEEGDNDDEVISQEEEEDEEQQQPSPPPVVQKSSKQFTTTKVVKESGHGRTSAASSKTKTTTVVETVAEKSRIGGKEAASKRSPLPPPPLQQRQPQQQQKQLSQAPLPPPPQLEEISEEALATDEGTGNDQQQQLISDSGRQIFGGGDQQQQQSAMMDNNEEQAVDAFKSLSLSSNSEDLIDRSRGSIGSAAAAPFEPPVPPPTRDTLFGMPNSSSGLPSFTPLSSAAPSAVPSTAAAPPPLPTPPATNLQQQNSFFMPPPPATNTNSIPSTYDSSAPFDFMSSGQVTSIPTYDPFPLDDSADQQQQKSGYANDYSNFGFNSNSNHHQQNHSGNSKQPEKKAAEASSSNSNPDSSKNSPSKNGGLLSSIFGIIKPKNQAILPDDKDPTIVYDPVLKKWVDKNASADGTDSSALPPPPKMLGSMGGAGGPATFADGPTANSTSQAPPLMSNGVGPSFPSASMGPFPTASSSPSPFPTSAVVPSAPAPARGGPGSQFRGRNRYIDVLQSNAKPPATS